MDRNPLGNTEGDEGWGKWGTHVIIEIQRLDGNYEALRKQVAEIDKTTSVDIRELKIRCSLYGGSAGAIIATIIDGLSWYLTHKT
jgi:hypothetical protein